MAFDDDRFSYYEPRGLNQLVDDQVNSFIYPHDAATGLHGDKDSIWSSIGRITQASILGGAALMASAYIPGFRDPVRKALANKVSPEAIRTFAREGSHALGDINDNFLRPLSHATSRVASELNELSPTDWLKAPIETFREFSTLFRQSYKEAQSFSNFLNLPESSNFQMLHDFRLNILDPMRAQHGSSGRATTAYSDTLVSSVADLLQDIRQGRQGPVRRHRNVHSAKRTQEIDESLLIASITSKGSRVGGIKEAHRQQQKISRKFGIVVDEILDYAGLDRDNDFRQATIRDLIKHHDTKIKRLETKGDPNNKRIQSQIARHYAERLSITDTLKEYDVISSGLGEKLKDEVLGRGILNIDGRIINTNISHGISGAVDAFSKMRIPGFNKGPMDIFQYPLIKKMMQNRNRIIGLPSSPGEEFKNLIKDGQFGHDEFGYGTRGGDKSVPTLFAYGRMHRITANNVETLTDDGFQIYGKGEGLSVQLTPLFTSVQRLLHGKGIVGGPGEDLAFNQSFLFSPHFNRLSRQATEARMDTTGWTDEQFDNIATGQKILGFFGIGNLMNISSREFSGPGIIWSMMRRKNEPWHRGAGKGAILAINDLKGQLSMNDMEAKFIHSGVLSQKAVTKHLAKLASRGGKAEKDAYNNVVDQFGQFMGRLDVNDYRPGSMASRLIEDFMGGTRNLSGHSLGVFRHLQDAKRQGSLGHVAGKKLGDILPGSDSIADETVLEFVQRSKFHQIIGTTASVLRKEDANAAAGFLSGIHSIGDRILKGVDYNGVGTRKARRHVKDLFNITMLKHNPDEAAVRTYITEDAGMKATLRRVLPFHRPTDESELPFSVAKHARSTFMIGNRSMQHAAIPTKDLAKMGLTWLFERPQRIRGGMLGESLPVGNIINPFRRGFFKGISDEITKPNPELMKHVKKGWVGSVLANNLLMTFVAGAAIYGIKPGGLIDTLTGGEMYEGIAAGLAGVGAAGSWAKNNIPFIPYFNVGGGQGTLDLVPGKINLGLSTFGDTARYIEKIAPKLISSPLTQNLLGGAMLFAGFKAGAIRGNPLLGLAAGIGAGMLTGMNLLDDPTTRTRDTYDILRGKKEIAHRANRWWMIGSTPFEGNEPLFYRPHQVAQIGMGERTWSRYGGGLRGKIRHLLYQAPIVGQFAQIANPNWVVDGRPDEMAYMESGVPLTYFPAIGPALAMGLQIMSGGQISNNLSKEATKRAKLLKKRKVKPENQQEFAIYMGADPYSAGDLRYLLGLQIKTMQNWLGIFGFMSEVAISKFGEALNIDALKTGHPFLHKPVYESSLEAENVTRKFYDLNIGDPGFSSISSFVGGRSAGFIQDHILPEQLTPSTEFLRRFLVKRPSENYTINLAPNPQYQEGRYPSDYFLDFRYGSDASRFNHYSDMRGYSAYSRGKYEMPEIAANMAPFSDWARSLIAQTPNADMKAELTQHVFQDIRKRIKTEPYRFVDKRPWAPYARQLPKANPDVLRNRDEHDGLLLGLIPEWIAGAAWENATHDPMFARFLVRKGWNQKTALEDYQEKKIYGHNFAQWERPYESFLRPMFYENLGKNPISAAFHTGASASKFFGGRTEKLLATFAGGLIGLGGSSAISASEFTTGDPFIPSYAKNQINNEMIMDTLSYTRGEASALGYISGHKSRRLGMPNLERKLYSQMKDLPEGEKAVLLELLPDRISQAVSPRGDVGEIRSRALEELMDSSVANIKYAHDNSIPTEVINAALVDRSGSNAYNYNIFPQMSQLGHLVDEKYGSRGYRTRDFERKFLMGVQSYKSSIDSQRAHVIIQQYQRQQQEGWSP